MQLSTLATATAPHLFWIASRAAGIAALILSSVSICVGLLMSTRARAGRGAELRVAHEALSLATLAALAVHGLTLLGDAFMSPSLADIAIPFVSSYKTLWTTAGIVAFWALALLGGSYYLRGRIGAQRWRRLHRFTAVAWMLGLAHALGEGTDAGQTWFLVMFAIAVTPALLALAAMWARRLTAPNAAARGAGARPAARSPQPATEQP
jgi:sulfoxide reductase heme-binding subunit YedZ